MYYSKMGFAALAAISHLQKPGMYQADYVYWYSDCMSTLCVYINTP